MCKMKNVAFPTGANWLKDEENKAKALYFWNQATDNMNYRSPFVKMSILITNHANIDTLKVDYK